MIWHRIALTFVCAIVCATAFKLESDKTPQLYCGSNKSASGTSIDGDMITYFATINNVTGPFAVHLYMKRVDCSPSCDPSVFSIFAADGKVRRSAVFHCFPSLIHLRAGHAQRTPVRAQRGAGNHHGCDARGRRDTVRLDVASRGDMRLRPALQLLHSMQVGSDAARVHRSCCSDVAHRKIAAM